MGNALGLSGEVMGDKKTMATFAKKTRTLLKEMGIRRSNANAVIKKELKENKGKDKKPTAAADKSGAASSPGNDETTQQVDEAEL